MDSWPKGGPNCPGSCGPYGPIRTIWTQSANQCSACVTSCEHMKCDSVVFIFASNCSHQRSCSCRLCKYFTNCVSFCPFSESVVLQISYLWPLHICRSKVGPCLVRWPNHLQGVLTCSRLYMGMPRKSGWAHALPQRVGPWHFSTTQSGLPSNLSCTRYTHLSTLACNCNTLDGLNTAITFDWRIRQYFSQEVYF